ncbi:hypothetical protein EBU71_03185 [bacterium]|nr:hypothetical protein [Candidatus Elulimicrobium humile]
MINSFEDYLVESVNAHMEHLEDLVFNEGIKGTRRAIDFLYDLRDMLKGKSDSKIKATVKWDGSPAIFIGVDPKDKRFFVATKSIFNATPKVYKSLKEILADEKDSDLSDKLQTAFTEFSKLGIKAGVYQGDIMFTSKTLKTERIDGESYITFHPNTIVYAIPAKSLLASKISKANIGVVFHTSYTGTSLENLKAEFGKSIINKFKPIPSIWVDDATYKDVTGSATFTRKELSELEGLMNRIEKLFTDIKPSVIEDIRKNTELLELIKIYNNSRIKEGEKITNVTAHVSGLFHFISDRFQKDIDSKKTEKAKATWIEKRKNILSYFTAHNQKDIISVFELTNAISDAKKMIIDKMNEASEIGTFLKTDKGFKPTGVEGFVAIDRLGGNAVKIVDRMEFSKANFSAGILKGWQR